MQDKRWTALSRRILEIWIGDDPKVIEEIYSRLRNLAWIESNRRKVEEATGGRVGYVYVPNTGRSGQNELVRQFTPQWNKDALIADERFNSGGQIPDRFIELLNRPVYNYWAPGPQRFSNSAWYKYRT